MEYAVAYRYAEITPGQCRERGQTKTTTTWKKSMWETISSHRNRTLWQPLCAYYYHRKCFISVTLWNVPRSSFPICAQIRSGTPWMPYWSHPHAFGCSILFSPNIAHSIFPTHRTYHTHHPVCAHSWPLYSYALCIYQWRVSHSISPIDTGYAIYNSTHRAIRNPHHWLAIKYIWCVRMFSVFVLYFVVVRFSIWGFV